MRWPWQHPGETHELSQVESRFAGDIVLDAVDLETLNDLATQLSVSVPIERRKDETNEVEGKVSAAPWGLGVELSRAASRTNSETFRTAGASLQLVRLLLDLFEKKRIEDLIGDYAWTMGMALRGDSETLAAARRPGTREHLEFDIATSMQRINLASRCATCARSRSWILIDGTWNVVKSEDEGRLELLVPYFPYIEDLDIHEFDPDVPRIWVDLSVLVDSANPGFQSPTGRARLRHGRHVHASVLGWAEEWADASNTLVVLPVAVFDHKGGDESFMWSGVEVKEALSVHDSSDRR